LLRKFIMRMRVLKLETADEDVQRTDSSSNQAREKQNRSREQENQLFFAEYFH
jgi:hypothetical protein